MLERARKRPQKIKGGLEFVSFIRAGEQNRVGEVEGGRLFGIVSDWQMLADDRKQFSQLPIRDLASLFGLLHTG